MSNVEAFFYTGGYQTWTVPNNVYSIDVTAIGGGGGMGSTDGGGNGCETSTTLSVNPADTINIFIGGGGGICSGGGSTTISNNSTILVISGGGVVGVVRYLPGTVGAVG